jgi:hypothetical protein
MISRRQSICFLVLQDGGKEQEETRTPCGLSIRSPGDAKRRKAERAHMWPVSWALFLHVRPSGRTWKLAAMERIDVRAPASLLGKRTDVRRYDAIQTSANLLGTEGSCRIHRVAGCCCRISPGLPASLDRLSPEEGKPWGR